MQTVGTEPAGQEAFAVTLLLITRSSAQTTCRGTVSWEAREPGVGSTHFQGFFLKRKMGAKLFDLIFPDTNGYIYIFFNVLCKKTASLGAVSSTHTMELRACFPQTPKPFPRGEAMGILTGGGEKEGNSALMPEGLRR